MSAARVLIVDDSALMRELLSSILGRAEGLEVVGVARDALQAGAMIERLRPDVLTLDVEMPHCDGLTFLEQLMRTRPVPVVMVSSVTDRGSDLALKALELGAVDVVEKPKLDMHAGVMERADELVRKVRGAALARPSRRQYAPRSADPNPSHRTLPSLSVARGSAMARRLIAIGASTGGTDALTQLLSSLPSDSPPVVVVQHMPGAFTGKFAVRLDAACRIRVREAKDGDKPEQGVALIAPGGRHLRIVAENGALVARLRDEPTSALHRPSVDVLFESVANAAGKRAIGVILTGMGADGARGLLEMRRAGARTFAQDEATCVVFGMPKEAIARGAVERVLPLNGISSAVIQVASERSTG